MQTEVRRLVNYFDAIHRVIHYVCRNQYGRLLDTIKDGMDQKSSDEQTVLTSLSEVQAQVRFELSQSFRFRPEHLLIRPLGLFVKLLSLRGHFAVINDNAQFYSQISIEHIMPALNEVGELPINSTSEEVHNGKAVLLSQRTRTIESAKVIQEIGKQVS